MTDHYTLGEWEFPKPTANNTGIPLHLLATLIAAYEDKDLKDIVMDLENSSWRTLDEVEKKMLRAPRKKLAAYFYATMSAIFYLSQVRV